MSFATQRLQRSAHLIDCHIKQDAKVNLKVTLHQYSTVYFVVHVLSELLFSEATYRVNEVMKDFYY